MLKTVVALGLMVVVVGVLFSACQRAAAVSPGERTFYINAIEIKGSTTSDKLAPPKVNPEELSQGFELKAPGVFDKASPLAWQVSSYMFNPSAMTVFQGDRVKLMLMVINGNKHKDSIKDPDGVVVVAEKEHNRGNQYAITFSADKAGIYTLHCDEHKETMKAAITVVPRG